MAENETRQPSKSPIEGLDMASQLAAGDLDESDYDDDEVSLEELSQSYRAIAEASDVAEEAAYETEESGDELPAGIDDDADENVPITPSSIIEAVLFVGREDSKEVLGRDIARLMRGVDEAEVDRCVDALNADYVSQGRAIRIVRVGSGYKVDLAPDLAYVRDRFYGRVKDVKLNQAAIDCLALVAYQPGVSRREIEQHRGQPSGGVLSQLVRRELLELRREGKGKDAEMHYFPTERMLQLAGMTSLDDLPQVGDWQ